ncbi:biotin-dependent carboxyltransferase family protein [Alkalihalobacillus sp. MEB130]|uniref:5-oxoprolinase subunit C family protein n=1 Tax=Alkalihalobacillus sp. MEB130 TaxID=2976704 RepID=UPI0028E06E1F|nr:biotin-dependent carboxyltransferase family protein [Alkalihalobacillus sp. MEB130]MDT8862687.1 biotin-dependent carboxyltransferase family protein [Alkalihalobacillus sp. MEB130]
MALKVLKPGLLTTIQDLGRTGFQKHGVIMSGAMDPLALRIANLLVGNAEDEAALEMTLAGSSLRFEKDALIAIAGGNLSSTIDNQSIPIHRPIFVKKNSILSFGPAKTGCRCYVAISGGLVVSDVMGSKSTYLRAKLGGFEGRALDVGDVIEFKQNQEWDMWEESQNKYRSCIVSRWGLNSTLVQNKRKEIRIIPGPHYQQFTKESQDQLFHSSFKVTPQSDRMGYRLSGPSLRVINKVELLSEGVTFGTIQVPPDGNPIILLADRQTIGGYPKIGQVIEVDIPAVAQLKPGEKISFSCVSIEEAEKLLIRRETELNELKIGIKLKHMK